MWCTKAFFCGLRIFSLPSSISISCDDKWKWNKKLYAHENRDMKARGKKVPFPYDNGSTISFISKIYHREQQLRIFSALLRCFWWRRMRNGNNKSEKGIQVSSHIFLITGNTCRHTWRPFSCAHSAIKKFRL